jgi:hypothetical protein
MKAMVFLSVLACCDDGASPLGPRRDAGTGYEYADVGFDAAPCSMPDVEIGLPDACAASTLECLRTAPSEEAIDACFAADPERDWCLECLNGELFRCVVDDGVCTAQLGDLACCVGRECRGLFGFDRELCGANRCMLENSAFEECLAPRPCRTSVDFCFADP